MVLVSVMIEPADEVPVNLRSAWLPIHIGLAFLADAAFAVAGIVSVVYVIQERRLKQKKTRWSGTARHGLPALEILDRLNFRLIEAGFPLMTLAPDIRCYLRKRGLGDLLDMGTPNNGQPPCLGSLCPAVTLSHNHRVAREKGCDVDGCGRGCDPIVDARTWPTGYWLAWTGLHLMRIAVIGLSHHTAPVALRERFAQNTKALEKTLRELLELEEVSEAVVLSTCNRVEYYVSGHESSAQLVRAIQLYLQLCCGLPSTELKPHIYIHEETACVRHLFRVASSLDSMVLGEPQILGQVKSAFKEATHHKAVGPVLTRVFQKAFGVAKRVRNETAIAENAVSMSFAAVELGREIFDDLTGRSALLIGAGEMATLAAKHLLAQGVQHLRVASRTLRTAERLAEEIGGHPATLTDLPAFIVESGYRDLLHSGA